MKSSRRRTAERWISLIGVACVALLVGLFAGGHDGWMPGWIRSAFTNQSAQDKQMQDVLGLIGKDYYRKVSSQSLANSSLEAAVKSLKDPYSHYYPPEQQQQFDQETNPQVSGIGVEVSGVKDGLYIDQVFPGGPAARAKLQQGETIVAVDGKTLAGLNVTKASDRVIGRSGTKVTLTILAGKSHRTVTVTRAEVTEPVVSGQIVKRGSKKLGYIVFAQFTQGSGNQLRAEVKKLEAKGAQGLVLDLRDNPGGLVSQAINVASIFLKTGTIVTTRGRNQPTTVYTALGNAIAPSIPLVLVVDRGTASAAEIVTAALQQHGRAKVVGARTYGKGVFQESQSVAGGGILDITVGEFFTPNGDNLGGSGVAQGKDLTRGPGIKPDYYVPDDPQDPGPAALKKAESVLASEITG